MNSSSSSGSTFQVYKTVFIDIYDDLLRLIVFNILWFLLTLLVIVAPPAAAGLFYITNELVHRRSVEWTTFFEGFRKYFWLSYRWAIMNTLVLLTLGVNILFYRSFEAGWAVWVEGVMIGLAVLWLALQIYTFPILLEQTELSLRIALRNSIVIYLRAPGISLTLIILLAILFVVSTFLQVPWVLLTGAVAAMLINGAMVGALEKIKRETSKSNVAPKE
jgi:uncharacterized membrane protein YesL